jgi:hypothetical protein
VLLLVEHSKPDGILFSQLNAMRPFQRVTAHGRFGVYVGFESSLMVRILPPISNDRVDFWDVRISRKNRLLLILVHGLDIINNSEEVRSLFFDRLRNDIVEKEVGHKQTVILGDFNANPFDAIIGGIRGVHAIRVRDVGGKLKRSVMKKDYEFFCNPMWSCYRGWEKSPPGTHYHNGSDVHELFWHMLDQVILRPQALHMFSEKNLRVLTETGVSSLLTSNHLPDRVNASDHLPVLFKLNLNGDRFSARRSAHALAGDAALRLLRRREPGRKTAQGRNLADSSA